MLHYKECTSQGVYALTIGESHQAKMHTKTGELDVVFDGLYQFNCTEDGP